MIVETLIGRRGDNGRSSYAGPAWVVFNSVESFDFLLRMENIVDRDDVLILSDLGHGTTTFLRPPTSTETRIQFCWLKIRHFLTPLLGGVYKGMCL